MWWIGLWVSGGYSSWPGQSRGAVLLRSAMLCLLCSSRLCPRLRRCWTGGFWAGALAQRAWPLRCGVWCVRPAEGRALQARRGGEGGGRLWRDRTGPRGRKVGGSVRANCPGVCQSRPSDSPRSLSPVRSVLAKVWRAGATSTRMARRTRNKDEREEIERAGRERPSAVRRRRTGAHTVLYMYRRCKYRPREGAVAGWGWRAGR